jgi:hypothetical protein
MMNDIDWEKVNIYLHADKTGFIEEETSDSLITLDFTWYVESCIDDWFKITVSFDAMYIQDKDTGNFYSVLSTHIQEILSERIETDVNEGAGHLGLDNYHEDKYLDFD